MNSVLQVGVRGLDRFCKSLTQSDLSSYCGRKCAAAAVGVDAWRPAGCQGQRSPVRPSEDIEQIIPLGVPPFEEERHPIGLRQFLGLRFRLGPSEGLPSQ